MSKVYSCEICDKHYKSYMGYWLHNKKKHGKNNNEDQTIELNKTESVNNTVIETPVSASKKIYACRKCDKVLSCKQSRWKHEQTCKAKENAQNANIKEENGILLKEKNEKIIKDISLVITYA